MTRPVVIGVRRAALPEPDAASASPTAAAAPKLDFDGVQAVAGLAAVLLGGAVWWRYGAVGFEMVLLLPFWFCSTPLLAWWAGHGVVTWSKREGTFVDFAADATSWRAWLLLGADAAVTVAIAVVLLTQGTPALC